ncbi:MAG: SusC/RagA family TonB-linked outer membrane protein [Bacteroidota bacterium]
MKEHFTRWISKSLSRGVLTLFALFLMSPSFSARANYKPEKKVVQEERLTIDQDLTVKELFNLISSKTNYDFFFNSNLTELDHKLSMHVENATIPQILNKAFESVPLEYTIKGNDILIRKRDVKLNEQGKRAVTGVVKDDLGVPLPEVNILVQNTDDGTTTDFDGNFTIDVAPEDVLVFSYLGFQDKFVPVGNNFSFDVSLEPATNVLDEVIVAGVASGTSRKKLSVSVAKLDNKALTEVPQASVSSSLTGKVAGVSVTSLSGSPGSSPKIVLRGSTNLTGNNSPMILMDGVIMQGSLADINVDDIENMEIVKGAAASSLYGSKAANGVIVITSKRGKNLSDGKTSVTIRNEFGFQQVAKYLDLSESHHYMLSPEWLDAETYTKYYYVTYPDDYEAGWDPRINGNRVIKEDHYQDMPYRVTRDLQEEMFNSGQYSTNFISVGHRVNSTNIYLSFENNENEGVVIETGGYKRNSIRANIDHAITDKIKISASNNFIRTSNDFLGGGTGAFFSVLMSEPDVDLFRDNVDGQKYNYYPNHWNTQFENPLYDLHAKSSDSHKSRFLGAYDLTWKLTDWMKFEGSYALESQDYRSTSYNPKNTISSLQPNYIDPDADNPVVDPNNPIETIYTGGSLRKYTSNIFNQSARATLSFKESWGDLDFNGKLSYLYEKNHFESATAGGSNFVLNDLVSLDNFKKEDMYNSDNMTDIVSENYFAIASFVYKDRFILDGLFRRDGSSLFGENERWHNYYRVSGAYRIIKDAEVDGIQELKLRAAYGTSGLRPGYGYKDEVYNLYQGAASKSTLGNKDLKPARANELEIGLETSFLDRFRFEATYSNSIVSDQYLLAPQLVPLGGVPYQWVNAGEIETNTFEATLNAKIIEKEDFSWDMTLTFDRTRQEITELYIPSYLTGPNGVNAFKIAEGETYGAMYGVDFIRTLEQMQQQLGADDDISNYSVNRDGVVVRTADIGTVNEKPFMVRDENGAEKNMKIGDINPDFKLGLNTMFRFKNLSAYMLWSWKQGGDLYNGTAQYLMRDHRHEMMDQIHTKPENKKTVDYYKALYDAQALNGFWVEDASYVKLQEASLYYTLDKEALGTTGKYMDHIKIGLLGRNLLTFTDYSGYDPEAGDDGFLFDDFGYPNFRSYTVSIELKF